MKRLLVLSILLAGLGSAFVSTSSFAQEDDSKRTVNPGEDPNEAQGGKPSEADVAAPGVCPECIARMKHGRLGDNTTYRPAGTAAPDNTSPTTREGTR
ncbi:hypothetical protein [Bdellovibrio sp. BCCA]|uniref:hypothetical protein n=1 Tax=unclassified Bdellovibrio TaxID=2633795 RepID=UPI0025D3D606|nr:hypothetical protein [uncultured Bdellovibrio sp.]